jgi:hypothetical protein
MCLKRKWGVSSRFWGAEVRRKEVLTVMLKFEQLSAEAGNGSFRLECHLCEDGRYLVVGECWEGSET